MKDSGCCENLLFKISHLVLSTCCIMYRSSLNPHQKEQQQQQQQTDISKKGNIYIKGLLHNENTLVGRLLTHAGGETLGGNEILHVSV